jgi:maltose alpha-D-glucosyltransferase/alpha-amylase
VGRPVIDDPVYGYRTRNVSDQRRDRDSLLNWTERIIRMRKECPEISWGDFEVLRTNAPDVLAVRYDWRNASLLALHNFSASRRKVRLTVGAARDGILVELFDGHHSRRENDGTHRLDLDGFGWRWYRVGGADSTLDRSALDLVETAASP